MKISEDLKKEIIDKIIDTVPQQSFIPNPEFCKFIPIDLLSIKIQLDFPLVEKMYINEIIRELISNGSLVKYYDKVSQKLKVPVKYSQGIADQVNILNDIVIKLYNELEEIKGKL